MMRNELGFGVMAAAVAPMVVTLMLLDSILGVSFVELLESVIIVMLGVCFLLALIMLLCCYIDEYRVEEEDERRR